MRKRNKKKDRVGVEGEEEEQGVKNEKNGREKVGFS